MEKISKKKLQQRWDYKRDSIYNLRDNINRLKLQVRKDLKGRDEKNKLTALVIRIMFNTSERVGNESSAENGRFGIT
jgi:DNA topoisomerase IB